MKTFKLLIFCFSVICFLSCHKKGTDDLNNVDVEKYVELLKEGNYNAVDLPVFTYNDIPALLEYRNETQLITNFPINGISSLRLSECKLGMYILWTIESVRAVAIDSEYLIGRFPSLNPIVQHREEPFNLEDGNEVHQIVSMAYFEWWENNKQKEFNDFKHIDPLIQTDYRWH